MSHDPLMDHVTATSKWRADTQNLIQTVFASATIVMKSIVIAATYTFSKRKPTQKLYLQMSTFAGALIPMDPNEFVRGNANSSWIRRSPRFCQDQRKFHNFKKYYEGPQKNKSEGSASGEEL